MANGDNIREGARSILLLLPPSIYLTRIKFVLENELLSNIAHMQTIQSPEKRKANQIRSIQYRIQKKSKIL